ncbi:MAG: hypothetical protein Hyperionvirus6_82 [Hyperionvirus sp.]|uniref:Uncharacterized protein n=1 Tax=Hyperionvirus sp. TaxID=2487770 RepID=A0A3G5AB01_9VIRU|nr:MAG: hypothetical protein Hyperionvirus6_82 [Hyperionvirus sp.]
MLVSLVEFSILMIPFKVISHLAFGNWRDNASKEIRPVIDESACMIGDAIRHN